MAPFLPSAASLGRNLRHSFLSLLFLSLALLPITGWGQSFKFDNLWNGDVYCKASPISVTFTTLQSFNTGNVFIAEISTSSGRFDTAYQIGSGNPKNVSGTRVLFCSLTNVPAGRGRFIRIRSTNPAQIALASFQSSIVQSSLAVVNSGQISADFPSGPLPIGTPFEIPHFVSCATGTINWPTYWLSDSAGNFGSGAIGITYFDGDQQRQGPKKKQVDSVADQIIPEYQPVYALIPDQLKSCSQYRLKVSYGDDATYSPALSDYYYTPIGTPTLTAPTTGYAGATFSGTLTLPCFLPANAGHINISLSDLSGTAGFVQRATISTLNGGAFSFTVPTNTLTGSTYRIQATTDVPGLWTWTSGNISILKREITISTTNILPVALLKPCQSLKLSEWEASFIIKELYTG